MLIQRDLHERKIDSLNPSNAKAQACKDMKKAISTISCWYSRVSSCQVLSDVDPCARVQSFLHHFVLAKLGTSSIRVNPDA